MWDRSPYLSIKQRIITENISVSSSLQVAPKNRTARGDRCEEIRALTSFATVLNDSTFLLNENERKQVSAFSRFGKIVFKEL